MVVLDMTWTDKVSQKLTNVIRVQIFLAHSVNCKGIGQVYKYRVSTNIYYKYFKIGEQLVPCGKKLKNLTLKMRQ